MKRAFIIIASLFIALAAYAQTQSPAKPESPHLSFKGVPIDGTLRAYTDTMKSAGFTYMTTQDGTALLKGDFAAYKGCIIGVSTLKKMDLVSTIGVIFPEQDTWSGLYGNYTFLKDMLTKKYGKPSDEVERFDSYSEPRDDGSRMTQVQLDKCKYYTIFSTPKGDIELSIQHNGVTSCFVLLKYYDKINTNAVQEDAMNDL